jgi:hypothetical protein
VPAVVALGNHDNGKNSSEGFQMNHTSGDPQGRAPIHGEMPSADLAGVVIYLRQISQTVRSVAGPSNALAEAASELTDASSFILEAMTTIPAADHQGRRELLEEALSCARAAAGVMRFALVRADDEVRLRCAPALPATSLGPEGTAVAVSAHGIPHP